MTFYVVPVIEGHTEAGCVERILHRVWSEILAAPVRLQVLPPSRGHRSALANVRHPELAEKVDEAHAKIVRQLRRDATGRGLVLILLDADEECPARLAPQLVARGLAIRSDADISCVLANRELENWFKAAASSLAGMNNLPADLQVPADPEVGSGDEWLTRQIRTTRRNLTYKKRTDAPVFAARMDLALCRQNAPSFDKLCRDLEARVTPPGSAG